MSHLNRLILEHRGMMRDELNFPPSQSRPPVAYRWDEVERAMVPDDSPLVINPFTPEQVEVPDSATHSTQIGVPISSRLMRYVSGPTLDTPWATALMKLWAWCRRNHRYHRTPPHWEGSLCHQLVKYVVIREYTLDTSARILQYDNPEPVLREALGFIEDTLDNFIKDAESKAKEDEGQALTCICSHTWSRHDDPATMFRCTACECRRYNAAPGYKAA